MKKATFLKHISAVSILTITALMFTGLNAATGTSETSVKRTSTVSTVYTRPEVVTTASAAKQLLIDGNKRFVQGTLAVKDLSAAARKKLATEGQKPFAVIVTCSDSRVPAELLFDQGLGDLFVIRDAGNVADAVTLGSIEYGAEHLNAPLIIVLGHENCGAVKATVDGIKVSDNIGAIINEIKPALEKAKKDNVSKDALYEECADENINNTVAKIKASPVIKLLEEEKKVTVIGAKYHLESGEVTFSVEK